MSVESIAEAFILSPNPTELGLDNKFLKVVALLILRLKYVVVKTLGLGTVHI